MIDNAKVDKLLGRSSFKVVRSDVIGGALLAFGQYDQNGDAVLSADELRGGFSKYSSRRAGEHDVEHDAIITSAKRIVVTGITIAAQIYLEALLLKASFHKIGDFLFVFDDQYLYV